MQRRNLREICGAAPDTCPRETSQCRRYAGIFDCFSVSTGVCEARCELGAQIRSSDDAPDCGSLPDSPTRGCFGTPWSPIWQRSNFVCMPTISDARHGDPPTTWMEDGTPDMRGCAAGYFPSPTEPHTCTAFCVPAETHAEAPENADGIAPFSCTDRGAVAPGSMECRYLHLFLETSDAGLNGSGVCVDTVVAGIPRCVDLGTDLIDTDSDGVPDTPEHRHWGCAPWPE